jgi:hypothetical protein
VDFFFKSTKKACQEQHRHISCEASAMSDLQILDDEISQALTLLQQQLQNVISAPTLPEKKKLEPEARPTIKNLKSQLNSLRSEARRAPDPTQKSVYENKHKTFDTKLKEIEKELRNQIYPAKKVAPKKSFSEKHMDDLMGEGGADGSGFQTHGQVLDAGIRVNKDALESLRRSERLAATAEDTGRETIVTLQKQTELLYRVDAELENLQGELDRAARDVKWFARQLAGDKCFLAVFAVVIFGLVGLVFYAMYKKKRG